MATLKLIRVQEKGQVTLPAALRRKLGIKKGDLVSVEETNGKLLITPQEIIASQALDEIGDILRQSGLTLEDLIESGRNERERILTEQGEGMGEQQ